jgi:hypothetical protein
MPDRETARITHPRRTRKLNTPWFVAFGTATRGIRLMGRLIGTRGSYFVGEPVLQPVDGQWQILFKDMTWKKGESFTLEIWLEDMSRRLDRVRRITLKRASYGVGISYPLDGYSVCNSNVGAYGILYPDDTTLTSCQLGGNDPVAGPSVNQDLGYWWATFSVTAGTYTLAIEGDASGSDSQPNIDCNANAC